MMKPKCIIKAFLLGCATSVFLFGHSTIYASSIKSDKVAKETFLLDVPSEMPKPELPPITDIPPVDIVIPEIPTDIPTPTQEVLPSDTPTPTQEVLPSDIPMPTDEVTPGSTPTPANEVTPSDTPTPTDEITPTETPTPTPSIYAIDMDGFKVYKEKEGRYYRATIEKQGVLLLNGADIYDLDYNKISSYSSKRLRLPVGEYYINKCSGVSFSVDSGYAEMEYNNSYDTANYISTDTVYTANINKVYGSDIDQYSFALSSKSLVYVKLTSSTENDYSIKISKEESNGNVTSFYEGHSTGVNFKSNRYRLESGTYFLTISSWNNDDSDYQFEVVTESNSVGNYETESNDTEGSATTLALATDYIGNTSDSQDKDYYAFRVEHTGKAVITMTIPRGCDNRLFEVLCYKEGSSYYSSAASFSTTENPVNVSKAFDVKPGLYYIKVSSGKYGSNFAAYSAIEYKIRVNVTEIKKITGLKIVSNSKTYMLGDKKQLTVTYNPTDTTETGVNWKTSDDEIATISSDGVLTCIAEGEVKITATSKVEDEYSDTITIKVKTNKSKVDTKNTKKPKKEGKVYDVETVDIGDSINLDFNYDDEKLEFSSSNRSIGKVTKDGEVTFCKSGKVTISVTREDGSVDKYRYSVNKKASSDATLKKIKASKGKIKKTGKSTYTITLSKKQNSTTIIPVTNHKKASYNIDYWYDNKKTVWVDSGEQEKVKVYVTAENGKKKTYTVIIKRQ